MNESFSVDYLILGGGPTGLGAAIRLQELGADYCIVEAEPEFGGLSSSFVDGQGFTWDLGGHVQFSHYETFDRFMLRAIPEAGWLRHRRESWIWMRGRFIPYPLQNNIHRLPAEDLERCLAGLKEASELRDAPPPAHFEEWMVRTAGRGIADVFLRSYNFKVWAYPPSTMAWNWVGERVAVPSYEKVLESLKTRQDDVTWGPNREFGFPKHGGTGSIWLAIGGMLPPERTLRNCRLAAIDAGRRTARTEDGRVISYKKLISTATLDTLIRMAPGIVAPPAAERLVYSAVNVIGLGIEGQPPEPMAKKCWMYFPESNSPYFRVTVFSNYSPFNVPQPGRQWSLMAEVSESPAKPVRRESLLEEVTSAMRQDGLLPADARICSTVLRHLPHGYPTPFLGRDAVVDPVLRRFEEAGIYSRGRFGAWKYEVANQDHSFAQGYECATRLVQGGGLELEPTLHTPSLVNSRRNP